MRGQVIARHIVLLLGIGLISVGPGIALPVGGPESEELFPVPPNLKANVDFWTKVYAVYTRRQMLLHDAERLDIVYEVVDLDSLWRYSEGSRYARVRPIENEYRAILTHFDHNPPIDTLGLKGREKRAYLLWRDCQDPYKYRKAAANLRWQQGQRDAVMEGLRRSGRFLEEMRQILRRYEVPEELVYLPLVESLYHPRAYSKSGAAGIWQFTRSTGRLFLKINYDVDERFDPIKATEAAAKLLRKNYEELGNWPLAVTAYNHGVNGMKRAQELLESSDLGHIAANYRGRAFGFASRNFYAEFLAAKHVMENREKYFGPVETDPPVRYAVFRVPHYVKASTLMKKFGLSKQEFMAYNPALRGPVLDDRRYVPEGYELRLPPDKASVAEALYAEIPKEERSEEQVHEKTASGYYRVREGDSMWSISRRFGVSIQELMAINGIDDPKRLQPGQLLSVVAETKLAVVPKGGEREAQGGGATSEARPLVIVDTAGQPAASAHALASTPLAPTGPYGPAVRPDTFYVDIPDPVGRTVVVLSDETIGHFADWLNLPVRRLRNLNGLRPNEDIYVGQRILVNFSKVTVEEFRRRRIEYHQGIREDFFQRFRVDSVRTHQIAAGENVYSLCRDVYDVPYWLVVDYNVGKNLQKLRPGDVVRIPVVSAINGRKTDARSIL
ncbi:MAG: LysM peptidoglycan-binding domain-containing protein [Calditrichaeota bacterium]|nr:LysM peptidoglycan-binding domain-containing protein [Calditrichota bacterium]